MELGGIDLRNMILSRNFSMTFEQKIQVALQIASAIEYMHDRNLIHRDIKVYSIISSSFDSVEISSLQMVNINWLILVLQERKIPIREWLFVVHHYRKWMFFSYYSLVRLLNCTTRKSTTKRSISIVLALFSMNSSQRDKHMLKRSRNMALMKMYDRVYPQLFIDCRLYYSQQHKTYHPQRYG